MAIVKADVMPLLLAACPSFAEHFDAYVASPEYEPGLLYIDLGELARHLVRLVDGGALAELPAVFAAVERLHVEGDPDVAEAATIGLLEGLQNNALGEGVDRKRFLPFVQPMTMKWWDDLDRFWRGEVPYVGAGFDRADK